jgi:hypothetical protein
MRAARAGLFSPLGPLGTIVLGVREHVQDQIFKFTLHVRAATLREEIIDGEPLHSLIEFTLHKNLSDFGVLDDLPRILIVLGSAQLSGQDRHFRSCFPLSI